jgi:hypothetical protein
MYTTKRAARQWLSTTQADVIPREVAAAGRSAARRAGGQGADPEATVRDDDTTMRLRIAGWMSDVAELWLRLLQAVNDADRCALWEHQFRP